MVDIDLDKQVVQFLRKPAKTGRNYIFVIPANYIKNGLIDVNKTYRIFVVEQKLEEKAEEREDID